MKIRVCILILIMFVSAFFGSTPAVFAQNQVSSAAERCTLAQSYLKNILKSRDLHARVDRLQAYQYIYQRLDVFVRRLERNNQKGASEMRASLNKFNAATDSFKTDYESYDKAREAVINVSNCRNNLAQFQDKLADARLKRELVNTDVVAIKQILESEIAVQLNTIYQSFKVNEEE